MKSDATVVAICVVYIKHIRSRNCVQTAMMFEKRIWFRAQGLDRGGGRNRMQTTMMFEKRIRFREQVLRWRAVQIKNLVVCSIFLFYPYYH